MLLAFHKRRLKCKDCSSPFCEQPYWLHPSSRITLALYADICRGLMTTLIHECASIYELNIPSDLAKWLLVEYGDEPYEGFWDANVLQELIQLHHDAYWNGMLDTELPDAYTIQKHLYEGLKDLITDLRDDIFILEEGASSIQWVKVSGKANFVRVSHSFFIKKHLYWLF